MEGLEALIVGLCGGGALLTFIQFLIARHDTKSGKTKNLFDLIDNINNDLKSLKSEMERDRAANARIRILSFSDEVRREVRHSKESFDQVNLDIDMYRRYCRDHPDYQNNRATMAIANIERVYSHCLENNDFLV